MYTTKQRDENVALICPECERSLKPIFSAIGGGDFAQQALVEIFPNVVFIRLSYNFVLWRRLL